MGPCAASHCTRRAAQGEQLHCKQSGIAPRNVGCSGRSRHWEFKLAFASVALVALTLAGCGGGGSSRSSSSSSSRATISRSSTANDDNDSISATRRAGLVSARETLQLSPNVPAQDSTVPLLRSPVRQSDPLVQIDRTGVPTGAGFDGGRVLDSADVAADSVVVCNETVDLPGVQRSVTALRVDATCRVRVMKSSDRQNLPVISFVEMVWTLSGVGVVRRAQGVPGRAEQVSKRAGPQARRQDVKTASRQVGRRSKDFERDLLRKDRALAQTAALLLLSIQSR